MRVALVFLGALIRPLGGLWPFLSGEENTACDKAGTCPQEGIEEDEPTRGSSSSPGAHYWWFNWTWESEPHLNPVATRQPQKGVLGGGMQECC